jgi:2,4-dienoyl-CoA reductase (NADPH2)
VLAAGQADLIGMARALIADPDWAVKAQRGAAQRIRLCVGDVQDCRAHLSGGLRCMVNGDVSNEAAAGAGPASGSLAVIGAGPAGLETARRAAERGLTVTVHEASDEPGGQLRLAAGLAGRAELADFVTYLTGELTALGVPVEYGIRLDVDAAAALPADEIVVATGSVGAPLAARTDLPPPTTGLAVRTVWDVLVAPPADPGRVVVLDDGLGDWATLTAAARLAGTSVTIATAGGSVLAGVPGESQRGVRTRLRAAGVRWLTDVTPHEFTPTGVGLTRQGTGETVDLPADLVVVATGRRPADGLWRGLRERRSGVVAVGDVQAPRTVGNAVRDAWHAVERILAPKVTTT